MRSLHRATVVALVLVGASTSTTSAVEAHHTASRQVRQSRHHHRHGCGDLYRIQKDKRSAKIIYHGTRSPSRKNLRYLGYLERCQLNPRAQWFVRWYNHRQAQLNSERRLEARYEPYDGWAIPRPIVMCESGGTDDSSHPSGPSGYYQIQPATWSSYGGDRYASLPYLASKLEQSIVASRIWDNGNGSGQWTCAAMTGY